jgi:hypothetical protein
MHAPSKYELKWYQGFIKTFASKSSLKAGIAPISLSRMNVKLAPKAKAARIENVTIDVIAELFLKTRIRSGRTRLS